MADQISENDVESLGEKLEAFSQTLTPGEQAALIEVLERATPQEGDVQGYGQFVRTSSSSAKKVAVKALVRGVFAHAH